jgi:hypothetical protein
MALLAAAAGLPPLRPAASRAGGAPGAGSATLAGLGSGQRRHSQRPTAPHPPAHADPVTVELLQRSGGLAMYNLVTSLPELVDLLLGDTPVPSGRYSQRTLGAPAPQCCSAAVRPRCSAPGAAPLCTPLGCCPRAPGPPQASTT